MASKKRLEDFKVDGEFVHKDETNSPLYDYSLIKEYINSKTPVPIICHKIDAETGVEHGVFYQCRDNHISMKQRCPKCVGGVKKDINYYINKSKKIHIDDKFNCLYDYSLIKEIKNNKDKVPIICKTHGVFYQSMANHTHKISPRGCPVCAKLYNVEETRLYNMLKRNFIDEEIVQNYKDKNLLNRQEIDIFFPKYQIGIEVQGLQHFLPCKGWGGEERLIKIIERDLRKINLCEENNIELLHFAFLKPNKYKNITYKIINKEDELIDLVKKRILQCSNQ